MLKIRVVKAMLRVTAASAISLLVAFSAPAQTVRYVHTDGLGSVVLTTDKDRNIVERSEYEPYGSLLNRPLTDGPGYTGHVMDAATGLTYMQQRYYDQNIGRVLSVDPVDAYENGDWRQFNRYVYAFNNPYKFHDPNGERGKVAWLVKLNANGMRKIARLTQEQAVRARRAGQNILANRRQVASQIETAAHGTEDQLKHAAHELKDGGKGLPHYQTDGVTGHSFWGNVSVAAAAMAVGLDKLSEVADLTDPSVSLTSGTPELENHRITWYGAYEQIDPKGPNFFEADGMRVRKMEEQEKSRGDNGGLKKGEK